MVLIILGIIFFIIGSALLKGEPKVTRIAKPFRLIGLVMIGFGLVTSSVRQVDAGYVGVKTLFGKVQPQTLNSGLSFINPLMDVTDIDIRTLNYTMSGVHDE
ncbi:MAG: hypothetical protein RLZZ520_1534, partial [Bacteroidota bacterium]